VRRLYKSFGFKGLVFYARKQWNTPTVHFGIYIVTYEYFVCSDFESEMYGRACIDILCYGFLHFELEKGFVIMEDCAAFRVLFASNDCFVLPSFNFQHITFLINER
jgi:hypothetical protein